MNNGIFGSFYNSMQMVESVHAVEEDGTRPLTVKRSFKERFLSLPWRPWVSTKVIQVPNYKPAIYVTGNKIVYHPALKARIEQSVIDWNAKS